VPGLSFTLCVSAGEPGGHAVQFFGRSRDGHDAPPTVRCDKSPARLAPHNRAGRGAYREGVMELGSEDRDLVHLDASSTPKPGTFQAAF
jgi:hypothetical protein